MIFRWFLLYLKTQLLIKRFTTPFHTYISSIKLGFICLSSLTISVFELEHLVHLYFNVITEVHIWYFFSIILVLAFYSYCHSVSFSFFLPFGIDFLVSYFLCSISLEVKYTSPLLLVVFLEILTSILNLLKTEANQYLYSPLEKYNDCGTFKLE